ncbi:MAG: hypothetical protein WBO29_07835 [Albidovulum sp.]
MTEKDLDTDFPVRGLINSDVINAIADWCNALHGDNSFESAFANLVCGLGAEAGLLARTNLNERHPSRVTVYDKKMKTDCHPLRLTFADSCFGEHMFKPRTASVWLASTLTGEKNAKPAPALGQWQAVRGMKEFAVLIFTEI